PAPRSPPEQPGSANDQAPGRSGEHSAAGQKVDADYQEREEDAGIDEQHDEEFVHLLQSECRVTVVAGIENGHGQGAAQEADKDFRPVGPEIAQGQDEFQAVDALGNADALGGSLGDLQIAHSASSFAAPQKRASARWSASASSHQKVIWNARSL